MDLAAKPPGLDEPLGDALLRPTRIYVRPLRKLYAAGLLRGAAHITGGGLVDNPTRMLPSGARLKLTIELGAWVIPPLYRLIESVGKISQAEMLRTFNCGVGMIVCVPRARAAEAAQLLAAEGETVFRVGQVGAADAPDAPVEFVE